MDDWIYMRGYASENVRGRKCMWVENVGWSGSAVNFVNDS